MSRKRVLELLGLLEESAKEDESAGRLWWAAQQYELISLIRARIAKEKEHWNRWYRSKGKAAQLRRKIKDALGESS